MLRVFSMFLTLLAIVTINIAANTVPLNGKKTVDILNSLPILFTPARYVFFIWVVIYAFLAIWIYGFFKNRHNKEQNSLLDLQASLFIFSSFFNIAWFLLWHYGYFDMAFLSIVILALVLTVLYFTYPKNENKLFGRIPISLYLGWIIIVCIANINYILTFHEWSGWGISTSLWTVIILTFVTAIALHFMYHYRDYIVNIVFMWVFVGIAVINGFDTLFISTASLFLTTVMATYYFIVKKKRHYAS